LVKKTDWFEFLNDQHEWIVRSETNLGLKFQQRLPASSLSCVIPDAFFLKSKSRRRSEEQTGMAQQNLKAYTHVPTHFISRKIKFACTPVLAA
jgi:hypothetical protein